MAICGLWSQDLVAMAMCSMWTLVTRSCYCGNVYHVVSDHKILLPWQCVTCGLGSQDLVARVMCSMWTFVMDLFGMGNDYDDNYDYNL